MKKEDNILYIEINKTGQLHVKPEFTQFTLIYRTATEIHWNTEKQTFYSPKPNNWSYFDWYKHIINVIENECSLRLRLTNKTKWINISNELKDKINDN